MTLPVLTAEQEASLQAASDLLRMRPLSPTLRELVNHLLLPLVMEEGEHLRREAMMGHFPPRLQQCWARSTSIISKVCAASSLAGRP